MGTLVATQIRVGMTILRDGEPYKVLTMEHVTPGKGRGMVHAKLKNLKTGATMENRFRSDEKVERAYLEQREMEYLYNTDGEYWFMDTESYEQISLSEDDLGENTFFLQPNTKFKIDLYEGTPVGLEPPPAIALKVVETAPNIKGATATSSLKPATLEGGLTVNVPSFIEAGEVIRVDTSEKKYLERLKQ